MPNKRKFLFLFLMILTALGFLLFSYKEGQREPEETAGERYEKLGAEKDRQLREQRERQEIGPR
jgi:hypothetical protein